MKRNWIYFLIIFLLLGGGSSFVFADVIELDNGSTIVGDISKVDSKKMVVQTNFAGLLHIDLKHVLLYKTDKPVHVVLPGHDKVFGKITCTKKQTRLDTPDEKVIVSSDKPEHVWLEGSSDPRARLWRLEVALDAAGKTGNAERFAAGGRVQTGYRGPSDKLLLYLHYALSKDDGLESENHTVGGLDYEIYFKEKHSFYARTELENDQVADIDFRATAAAGYGYFFLKTSDHELRGRIGLLYRYESLKDQSSDSTVGVDMGLWHQYRFANTWKLLNNINYTPSLKDYRTYLIHHESTFEIPLVVSGIWKFQIGMSNDYNSRPAQGKDYLDTTYFSRLVLTWQ